MATRIDAAVEWAVNIANDPAHGYDQAHRHGPDYDCSSLIYYAWKEAGVTFASTATRTTNMIPAMLKQGFIEVTSLVNFKTGAGLQKGDVLWRVGHTEMMASATTRVGAHSSESGAIAKYPGDQTGHEIDVSPYLKSTNWTRAFRYPGGSSETVPSIDKSLVISKNAYLTTDEMYINAMYVAAYLYGAGWTTEAIAGLLGNMQAESTINPGIWQSLNEGNTSGGFGLCQWTPATKLIEWASSTGRDYTDIDTQLDRLLYEMENGIQYYPTELYPETFVEFSQSFQTPEYLAAAFLFNYERPAVPNVGERQSNARYWFNLLSSLNIDPLPGSKKRKTMSLLLMYAAIVRRK